MTRLSRVSGGRLLLNTDIPASITGDKNIFLRVIFAPTKAKAYSGTITVESDAENTPSATFPVSGCGIRNDEYSASLISCA